LAIVKCSVLSANESHTALKLVERLRVQFMCDIKQLSDCNTCLTVRPHDKKCECECEFWGKRSECARSFSVPLTDKTCNLATDYFMSIILKY